MADVNLNRNVGESESAYIKRIGRMKDAGIIDFTWGELADVFNRNLRDDGLTYGESAYRKKYASIKKYGDEFGYRNSNDEVEELKKLKEEIQKEKRKLFDQRREYNKLLTSDARSEYLTDYMIDAANRLADDYPFIAPIKSLDTDATKEAILCLSDWHYGMVTDNIWNKYNAEICRERIAKVVAYTKKYLALNKISRLHIVMLGDSAHGSIHTTARVKSEEDTCDQIMHVAEILAQVVDELSQVTNQVIFYSCYGNHLRTVQKKEDSIHTDNMEKVIPWWLKQRLKDNPKVIVKYSDYKEFTHFNVLGYNIVCVHGDQFEFKNIGVTAHMLFSKLFDVSIDYTISGDRHHLEEFGQYGVDSILVRSLCGCDDYANGKRLYDKPGQTLLIFNEEYGREATYHIPLN